MRKTKISRIVLKNISVSCFSSIIYNEVISSLCSAVKKEIISATVGKAKFYSISFDYQPPNSRNNCAVCTN